ncbi:hypothetical protein SKAU_G00119360 [Synaphobranchus kaupii]|uniref:Monocarboxylate transporter 6 n=1 Tax=Synaphobranchus kaupii TaxID=118154 RepID=A0A9Q1FNU8_SYNKA|nr:hypothetical protein SKAU_G00119360 [Synaphobranchus kaupii]
MRQREGHTATNRRGGESAGVSMEMVDRPSPQSAGAGVERQTKEPSDGDSEERGEEEGQDGSPVAANSAAGGGPRVLREAPDGGWGWVVLASSVLVLALTLAFPSCIGIFYTDLQEAFQASNSETSWVPSIMTAVLHAGGPLCSVLVERYGCRTTVMLGGVLSGLGMAASSFTNSIIELYITAGVITGLGFCFSFQPAVTILGQYFVRRRASRQRHLVHGHRDRSVHPALPRRVPAQPAGLEGELPGAGGRAAQLLRVWGGHEAPEPQIPAPRKAPKARMPPPLRPRRTGRKSARGRVCREAWAFDLFLSNLRFRVYALGITWMMLGFVVPLIFLVPYATANGMDQSRAALLLAILGFVNIIVRPPRRPALQPALVPRAPRLRLRGGAARQRAERLHLLPGAQLPGAAGIRAGLRPLHERGGLPALHRPHGRGGDESLSPAALGLLAIMESVTLLVGPPLAGLLVDRTGDYTYMFFACSAIVASSAIFIMVAFSWLDRRDREMRCPSKPQVDPQKAGVTLTPDCEYSSVPTKGASPPLQRLLTPPVCFTFPPYTRLPFEGWLFVIGCGCGPIPMYWKVVLLLQL